MNSLAIAFCLFAVASARYVPLAYPAAHLAYASPVISHHVAPVVPSYAAVVPVVSAAPSAFSYAHHSVVYHPTHHSVVPASTSPIGVPAATQDGSYNGGSTGYSYDGNDGHY